MTFITTKLPVQIDGSAEVSGSKKGIDTTAPLIHSYEFIKVTDGKQKLHKAFNLCEYDLTTVKAENLPQ